MTIATQISAICRGQEKEGKRQRRSWRRAVDLPQKGLPGQDPNKEVITKLRTWDVLLSNFSLREHTLRSVLHISQSIDDPSASLRAGGTRAVLLRRGVDAGRIGMAGVGVRYGVGGHVSMCKYF